jgi:hypothetical protein
VKEINWQGVAIDMPFDVEVSEAHVEEDFRVLEQTGIERIIRERFIPWLKGEEFTDRDDEKIFEGLQLYEITYTYGRIIARYSPTGEENYFGQFEFSFESGSAYTADMLEAVAMQVYVLDGKIVKVDGYDV